MSVLFIALVFCVVYPMLPVSLYCLFLFVPSVFSSLYFRIKLKNKKYHTVEIILKSNIKITKEVKLIPLLHKYMNTHIPGMVQALQKKVTGLRRVWRYQRVKLVLFAQSSPLSNRYKYLRILVSYINWSLKKYNQLIFL